MAERKRRWAICDHDGLPIIIRVRNQRNEWEEMVWFANMLAAQQAFEMMDEEDIRRHGANIREVALS